MCLAVPGQIISMNESASFSRKAKVSFGGVVKDIGLAFVPEAKVGDYVIVHVGYAISVIDDEEAANILDTLAQMDELTAEGAP